MNSSSCYVALLHQGHSWEKIRDQAILFIPISHQLVTELSLFYLTLLNCCTETRGSNTALNRGCSVAHVNGDRHIVSSAHAFTVYWMKMNLRYQKLVTSLCWSYLMQGNLSWRCVFFMYVCSDVRLQFKQQRALWDSNWNLRRKRWGNNDNMDPMYMYF